MEAFATPFASFVDAIDAQMEEMSLREEMKKKTRRVYTDSKGRRKAYVPIISRKE